jgi:catechol-2,3-dioxygenase
MSDDFDAEQTPAELEHPPAPRSAFDHHVHLRLGSLESSRRFWRWVVGLGAPTKRGGR